MLPSCPFSLSADLTDRRRFAFRLLRRTAFFPTGPPIYLPSSARATSALFLLSYSHLSALPPPVTGFLSVAIPFLPSRDSDVGPFVGLSAPLDYVFFSRATFLFLIPLSILSPDPTTLRSLAVFRHFSLFFLYPFPHDSPPPRSHPLTHSLPIFLSLPFFFFHSYSLFFWPLLFFWVFFFFLVGSACSFSFLSTLFSFPSLPPEHDYLLPSPVVVFSLLLYSFLRLTITGITLFTAIHPQRDCAFARARD